MKPCEKRADESTRVVASRKLAGQRHEFSQLNRMKVLLEHMSDSVGTEILSRDSQGTVNAPEDVTT